MASGSGREAVSRGPAGASPGRASVAARITSSGDSDAGPGVGVGRVRRGLRPVGALGSVGPVGALGAAGAESPCDRPTASTERLRVRRALPALDGTAEAWAGGGSSEPA